MNSISSWHILSMKHPRERGYHIPKGGGGDKRVTDRITTMGCGKFCIFFAGKIVFSDYYLSNF